jgi:hypothetical protein
VANAPDMLTVAMDGMEPITMMKYAKKMWNVTHVNSERLDKASLPKSLQPQARYPNRRIQSLFWTNFARFGFNT